MSHTRSEYTAHAAQLDYINAQATSADWRAALATREVNRSARLYRQTRQPAGSVRIALAMGCIAVGAVAFRMHDACIRAAVALSSVLS